MMAVLFVANICGWVGGVQRGVGGVQGEGLGCCQGCFLEAGGHIPETPYIWRKSDVTALQFSLFFPTCQVRVVRFYVSLFSFSSASSASSASSSVSLSCRDSVSSVWHAGPQPRSCEVSVACRTPTAILRVQCGVPDPNRDPANSVWRPGPQPRSCEFSVASRTPTAIL